MTPPPISGEYADDWKAIARDCKERSGGACVRCLKAHNYASGHVLTVHHFDGNKANNEPWNLMALCQRCHLSVQARVDPNVPLMFDPSTWAMPYIAGFYAAGRGMPAPGLDVAKWIETYERERGKWPEWAVRTLATKRE